MVRVRQVLNFCKLQVFTVHWLIFDGYLTRFEDLKSFHQQIEATSLKTTYSSANSRSQLTFVLLSVCLTI